MTTEPDATQKKKKKRGTILAGVSAAISVFVSAVSVFLWSSLGRLEAAGRMKTSDSEGCTIALLYAGSFFTFPISIGLALVLAVIAIALRARLTGGAAVLLSLMALVVYIIMFHIVAPD